MGPLYRDSTVFPYTFFTIFTVDLKLDINTKKSSYSLCSNNIELINVDIFLKLIDINSFSPEIHFMWTTGFYKYEHLHTEGKRQEF